MSKKLTDWIPSETPPAYKGGYQFRYANRYVFPVWWDGQNFLIDDPKAPYCKGGLVQAQGHWRGLAVKP